MDIWQTLGIAPTTDAADIKAAYAAQAKQYHPEEHPEAFRTVHAAYREALRHARKQPQPAQPQPRVVTAHPKPAYVPRDALDNARRSQLYLCADDLFTDEQFRALYKLVKRAPAAEPSAAASAASLQHLLRIRGAAPQTATADDLDFQAVLQDNAEPERPPAVTLQEIQPIPKPARLVWLNSWPRLILCVTCTYVLTRLVPAPVTAVLYAGLLCLQWMRSWMRSSGKATLFAFTIDFLALTALSAAGLLSEDTFTLLLAALLIIRTYAYVKSKK